MKNLMSLVALLIPMSIWAEGDNELIAKDSLGLIIEVNEKYGGTFLDTCTAVVYHENEFVIDHYNGVTTWYPASFHTVRVIGRLTDIKAFPEDKKQLSGK